MKIVAIATVVAGVVTVAALSAAAPAMSAPRGASAIQTISQLEAQGYRVIVNRLSDTPLNEATVVSVGEGATFTHIDANAKNSDSYTDYDHQFAPDNLMTVYVNVR